MKHSRFRTFGIALLAVMTLALVSGCVTSKIKTGDTAIQDMNTTDKTVTNLTKTQPLPVYEYSQERANLLRRLDEFNKPDKISYIVLIHHGKIWRYCTVKGKVSSLNSLVSNPQQFIRIEGIGVLNAPLSSPDLDGSYGDNPEGIFFYTTDGEYVEWTGDYMVSTRPLNLSTPPEVTINVK